jgi:hypothetical protein
MLRIFFKHNRKLLFAGELRQMVSTSAWAN